MYVHFSSWEERIFWNRIFEWPCSLAACRETRLTDCIFPALAPIHPIISSAHRLNWVEIILAKFWFQTKFGWIRLLKQQNACWMGRELDKRCSSNSHPGKAASWFCISTKYTFQHVWTNTFGYLDKYILQFGQIHFETWTREYKCRGNSCTGKATSSIQTFPNSCHTFSLSCNKKYKAQFHSLKKYTMQFNQR